MKNLYGILSLAWFVGCTSVSDEPQRVLLDKHYGPATVGQPTKTYNQSVTVELAGKTVPVRFEWAAVRQPLMVQGSPDSCWKIVSLRVERTGGDPSIRFTAARSVSVGCALGSLLRNDMNAEPRAEYRSVFLSYETQSGIKHYTVIDSPLSLNGKGEFKNRGK